MVYLCVGTWPVYGNPTLGLFLNHFRSSDKAREEGEREREEHYLIATCLTRGQDTYNEKQRRAFKGNLLIQYREPRISVRNESLVSPDDTRAFSIARTDSPAKPRRESQPKGRGLASGKDKLFPPPLSRLRLVG